MASFRLRKASSGSTLRGGDVLRAAAGVPPFNFKATEDDFTLVVVEDTVTITETPDSISFQTTIP